MSTTSPRQLFLLADHLKLSLLERQRAITLNLEPHKQDSHISRTLANLQEGIEALEAQQHDLGQPADDSSEVSRLRKQYEDLYTQFHGSAPPSAESRRPNDPALAETFEAAQAAPRPGSGRRNKSVRFRDNPNEEDPVEVANRAALFSDQERYRDEPDHADQSDMDNQQIHAYHKQVLRDQDEQLDTLGQSIGRQRVLGIQMGNELDEQNELLEDVEGGVDRHTTTLERARKRLGHVARKSKDNWSWVTIGILIIILVLLIVVLK
jgi:syntaxin 8